MIHCRLATVVFLTCVTGTVVPGASFAQTGRAARVENARLDLGLTVAAPDAPVELKLTLRLPERLSVGKVEATVRFPKNRLAFVAPRPTPKGVQVKVEPQPEQDGNAVLKVFAESPDGPIAAGVLTTLVFRVAKETPENSAISVPLEARLWTRPDMSQEITPVDTFAGRVAIQDAATFFGCFFYMH